MSLFKIFDAAGSGLNAQSIRLNTTASNLANADSVSSSDNATYRARHPVFSTVLLDNQLGMASESAGVRVERIVESQAPLRSEYRPDHPLANPEGYIFRSNVNVVEEMADMMSANRSFNSNLEVMNAAKQMLLRTLSLGQ